MKLAELVAVSAEVAATRSRKQKVARLAELLRRLGRDEIETGACFLAGTLADGRIGVGYASVRRARVFGSTPHAHHSFGSSPPMPTPRMRRPFDIRSIIAHCSAIGVGWRRASR